MKLVFLGPPGAGKGTLAHRVMDELGLVQISTGDLLRSETTAGTELGIKAKACMDEGHLVPDDLVIAMLRARIARADCANGYILDGFPRTIPQAEALEASGVDVERVINFVVADAVIVNRISGRRIHAPTGRIFNINPGGIPQPPPEVDQADLVQRADDQPAAIANRLVVYREQTAPLIAFYAARNLISNVDVDRTVDEIVADVLTLLT
jgi:adenylate kinase